MKQAVTIEIDQSRHNLGSINDNMNRMIEHIRSSSSDLIVFPEMFLSGYTLGSDVQRTAISSQDGVIQPLIDVCSDTQKHIIFGFPRKSENIRGQIHNSAMVVGPDRIIGTYDKIHLVDFGPFEEWAYFTPGRRPFIFSIKGFKIGIIICYDIFFPELTKYYALNGADAVVCISASPSITRTFFESVMRARAIESTVYFIYSNLVGFDSRMDFWGGSEIIDPKGNTEAKGPYFEEDIITGRIDSEVIKIARQSRPTLRDTRSLLYGMTLEDMTK